MKQFPNERGQALVLAALCMSMLLGFLGFAIDVGLLFVEKRKVQVAADIAAAAGAAELNYGDYAATAQAAAAQNGFTNGVSGVTVSVNPSGTAIPSPQNGAYAGQAGYLEVVVSEQVPTYFMRVMNFSSMTVSARAVGAMGASQNCIYALAGSGTAFSMSNDAKLTATGCGVVDNSSGSSAMSVVGSASLTAASVGVVGSVVTNNNGSISPTAVSGVAPSSDPLAYLSPPAYTPASCGSDPLTHYGNGGSTYSVGPGSAYSTTQSNNTVCYTSLTLGSNNDTVTINPGIYVITGALTFASGTTLGGNGVTFYLVGSGSVNIGNNASLNFTAPTSGTYDGILFYQDRADTRGASIQGGASSSLTGILYFPAAALSIGNGTSSTISSPLIANTISLVGGSTVQDNDYATVNPSTPLTSPRLVE
jgi:Flp pilus assembly protein TadG